MDATHPGARTRHTLPGEGTSMEVAPMRSIARFGTAMVVVIALFMMFPGAASAAWEPLSDTAANIQKVCTDGIKFEAGIIKSFNRRENPYKAHAAVANPPPTSRPAPAGTVIVRQKIKIYKYQKVVDLPDGGKLALSHYGKYELRFQHKQAVGDTVALGLKNFAEGSGITTATVTNCRLFY
jgi:hypothetical protein